MQINPGDSRVCLIIRWPSCDPRLVYLTALLQHMHRQLMAALELLTAMANYVASHNSILEMQVHG